MVQIWGVHGVPMAMQHDGWWLDNDPAPFPATIRRSKWQGVALVLLVLLADVLFWGHSVGLSLALFAVAVFTVAVFAASHSRPPRASALLILTLSVLPALDFVQPLSVLFLICGLITAITLTRLGPTSAATTLHAALNLTRHIPLRGLRDLIAAVSTLRPGLTASGTARQFARQIGRTWAFPVGGTLILLALLIQANPILDGWLSRLTHLPIDPLLWVQRALFWSGVALILWPLLVVAPTPGPRGPKPLSLPGFGLNATSVAHALIAFNTVLGLQTVLDLRYLWSGASLPPGMTLAEYAHRGAYPLLATALLAGAFAVAARPWLAERRSLKPLLILWLAQNILLTLSALYRLDLYVQSFGLTYLRVHALIWIALVAAGLALTLTQIATARSNPWLLIRCLALGLATLYAAAFLNFADLIARTNVAMGKIDPLYLCQLGPTAAAVVPKGAWKVEDGFSYDSNLHYCTLTPPAPQNWRNWGFRNWLVLRTLTQQEATP